MEKLKEILIGINESEQRLDRFLMKYLDKASRGFIYKMIRKKNIVINGSRVKPDTMIFEGDKIQLYMSDETINKFTSETIIQKSQLIPNIIYEDDNIMLMNKDVGILSHSATWEQEDNMVSSMINYLMEKGDYNPEDEKTFIPSICNRLDMNTSGIIIGGKNYQSLKAINEAMKNSRIQRFYKTIVKGQVNRDFQITSYLVKDEDKNKVEIYSNEVEGAKKIVTKVRVLKKSREFSLLEIELITGRTHQIRAHLSSINHPIIGDRKYGDFLLNESFSKEYGLMNHWLHAYKIIFNGLEEPLKYLNGREFNSDVSKDLLEIERRLFSK